MSGPVDGGPAFPGQTVASFRGGRGDEPGAYTFNHHGGMSLRDWFAGQVLASMVNSRDVIHALNGGDPYDPFERNLGKAAYRIADAMLAERERQS